MRLLGSEFFTELKLIRVYIIFFQEHVENIKVL